MCLRSVLLFCFVFTGAVWCVGFCTGKRHDGLLQEVFDVLGFFLCFLQEVFDVLGFYRRCLTCWVFTGGV